MDINSNTVKYNIGGQEFSFARGTIEQDHLKGSVISISQTKDWSQKEICHLDVDPELFKKYCAPYIRFGVLPSYEDFKNTYEIKHLFHTAESIGLFDLAKSIKKYLNKVIIRFESQAGFITMFDERELSTVFDLRSPKCEEFVCPDQKCGFKFIEYTHTSWDIKNLFPYTGVLSHFASESHHGTVKLFTTDSCQKLEVKGINNGINTPGFASGVIECFMEDYKK